MAAALIFDFHLGNEKFAAVINITFYFDAGALLSNLWPAVALNLCTSVSFERLASDNPSRILCGGHLFNFSVKSIIVPSSESGER